jgi:uncharacterized membrane protein
MLQRLHGARAFQDDNAVCVVRATDWRVRLIHGSDLGRRDDRPRQFWQALVASLVLAPGTEDRGGGVQDYGITPRFEQDLWAALPPGSSAVFMILDHATLDELIADLYQCGGTLLQTPIAVCD